MRIAERRPRRAAAVAGLIVAAGLTACGGGASSISAQDFQAEANRVCRDAEREINRIQAVQARTAAQAEKQAAALADFSQQALSDLRRIEPPAELKPGYERYLRSRQRAIGLIEDARDAAASSDVGAYARAKTRLAQQQPQRRALALRAGLRDCSRPTLPG